MILIIDNYDSFAYNIANALREMERDVVVVRNDQITTQEIQVLSPEAIVIAPGGGRPEGAGISLDLVRKFAGKIPLLGISLGHLVIAEAFKGKIVPALRLMHGKTTDLQGDGKGLFAGITSSLKASCYHSFVVDKSALPKELEVSALSAEGEVMGIRHKTDLLEGVQFHPESIMTPMGKKILRNFLVLVDDFHQSKKGG